MSKYSVKYDSEENMYHLYVSEAFEDGKGYETDLPITPANARDIIRQFVDAGVSMNFPDQSYGAGELTAMKEHLADMRRIVFEDKS